VHSPPSALAVARALSLPETAVVRCWFAGVGLRFCFVQLTDQDMVDRATLDTSAWRVGLADGWSPAPHPHPDLGLHSGPESPPTPPPVGPLRRQLLTSIYQGDITLIDSRTIQNRDASADRYHIGNDQSYVRKGRCPAPHWSQEAFR
jgi:hypothetical protein